MASNNGNTWQLPVMRPGGGVPPLADHIMQFERQVIALKDSQDLLLASINDVISELERVRGALPAADLAQRVMRLADLQRRLVQLGTLLTTVEGRLARIQAHLDQKEAESGLQGDEPSQSST